MRAFLLIGFSPERPDPVHEVVRVKRVTRAVVQRFTRKKHLPVDAHVRWFPLSTDDGSTDGPIIVAVPRHNYGEHVDDSNNSTGHAA